MSLTSLTFFLALFPIGLGFYLLPSRFRPLFLLVVSLGFYALSQPYYLLLLIAASGLIFGCSLKISSSENEKTKQLFLTIGVGAIVAMIVIFKTLGAFHGLLMPLGISYYSFRLLCYIIEVYWDDESVETDFVYFLLYASFFPQMVSGPIQRSYDFLEQIRKVVSSPVNYAQIESGFRLILSGLLMKILVGDRLDSFIETTSGNLGNYTWPVIFLTILCYTIQLYADFSGYTNIALGVGKIFGIDGPPNFNAPFAAANIQQMWQRWHMSLTTWLTDYLFTPLNMALRSWGNFGMAAAITLDMVIIGLWHGFKFHYFMYGICHAAFMLLTIFTQKWRDVIFGKSKAMHTVRITLGIITTFTVSGLIEIVFRTNSWAETVHQFSLLFGLTPAGATGLHDIDIIIRQLVIECMVIALYAGFGAPGFKYIRQFADRFIPNWVQYGVALLVLSALSLDNSSSFVYGQF